MENKNRGASKYGEKNSVKKDFGAKKNYAAKTGGGESKAPRTQYRKPAAKPAPQSEQLPRETEEQTAFAIVGRNAVLELLKSGRDIDKIFVQKIADREAQGASSGSLPLIVGEAIARKIPVIEVDKIKLDSLADGVPHQGVAALAPERDYNTLDEVIELARERGEKPIIIIADGIEDPHNLGAIIRVAEGSGAHGIIIPKRRSSPMTQVVSKASAGAVEYMPIVKVPNLAQVVRTLKDEGFWIFAAESGGTNYDKCDFDCPCAIILGSEGEGVSKILRDSCDYVVSIPMKGKVNSLNVSTAAAVIMYEIVRQRTK